jgi:hypothetical protein
VHKWLRDQPEIFFLEGIRKLVDRWTKCIEKEGDCVEKIRTCSGLHLCTHIEKIECGLFLTCLRTLYV